MYIPEFWCGIISVVLVAVAAAVAYCVYDYKKTKKKGGK